MSFGRLLAVERFRCESLSVFEGIRLRFCVVHLRGCVTEPMNLREGGEYETTEVGVQSILLYSGLSFGTMMLQRGGVLGRGWNCERRYPYHCGVLLLLEFGTEFQQGVETVESTHVGSDPSSSHTSKVRQTVVSKMELSRMRESGEAGSVWKDYGDGSRGQLFRRN